MKRLTLEGMLFGTIAALVNKGILTYENISEGYNLIQENRKLITEAQREAFRGENPGLEELKGSIFEDLAIWALKADKEKEEKSPSG